MPPDPLEFVVPAYGVVTIAFACILALMGLTGLAAPKALRTGLRAASSRNSLRAIGAAMAFVGAMMLIRPSRPYAAQLLMPQLAFWLGILTLTKGLGWLLVPGIVERVMEFHLAQHNLWHRILGIVCLASAILFFLAARVTAVIPF